MIAVVLALDGFVVEMLADEEVLDAGGEGKRCEVSEVEMAELERRGHRGKGGGLTLELRGFVRDWS